MDESFKVNFCERFGCSLSAYEKTLFWKCLYRHALPLAFILCKIRPSFFKEDFEFIRELGSTDCRQEVIGELNRFYGRNVRDRSWLRKGLLIRVSGKRLLKVQKIVFAKDPIPS